MRHDHASEGDFTGRLHEIFVAANSHNALKALEMGLGAHHEECVTRMDDRCWGGNVNFCLVPPLQAGHSDLCFVQAGDLVIPQALEIRIVDPQVRPLDLLNIRTLRLLELCDFPRHVNPKQKANNDHADDDSHDAQGVGDSV